MFTVKHVSPTGYEAIYEAAEVSFTPETSDTTLGKQLATVWYTDPKTREIKSLNAGHVFVTNEAGATVAKYGLGDSRSGMLGPDDIDAILGSKLPKREKPEFFDKRYDNVVD